MNGWNKTLAGLFLVFSASFSASAAVAGEIGYVEDFALAADRAVPLQQLIPGTEDYYYYHCLHFQNTEQFDKVEQLLQDWIKRHNYTPRVREILNRQALLTYAANPAEVAGLPPPAAEPAVQSPAGTAGREAEPADDAGPEPDQPRRR